jgi:hypothetical protein
MVKAPYYIKKSKVKLKNGQLYYNFTIRKWALPILAIKTFWKQAKVKPVILKPFLAFYFGVKMLFAGGG